MRYAHAVADDRALIFAKYPEPGGVKTRLIGPLSSEQAAQVHRASLLAVCECIREAGGWSATLVATPDDRVDDFRRILQGAVSDCLPQGDGDLGARLIRAANRAFAAGAEGVLLLGADSPTLPPERLRQAMMLLAHHDAVLGPCEDGGYYLLAFRRALPGLFQRIDWGGACVAAQTRERAKAMGIDLCELRPWYDLDRFDDLVRAASDLKSMATASRPAMIDLRRLIEACVRTCGVQGQRSKVEGPRS